MKHGFQCIALDSDNIAMCARAYPLNQRNGYSLCFARHYCQHRIKPLPQIERELFGFTGAHCQKGWPFLRVRKDSTAEKTAHCFTGIFACSARIASTHGQPFVAMRPTFDGKTLTKTTSRGCKAVHTHLLKSMLVPARHSLESVEFGADNRIGMSRAPRQCSRAREVAQSLKKWL
jgi:hypothetical protein